MQEQVATPQPANRQIARAAGTVMVAFIISNLVGVIRGMVITQAFGTSADLDSFNAANRIAELLFSLVAGGALGSAFIPVFTSFLTKDDRKGAWWLASGVINLLTLVLILISIIAFIIAPQIVSKGLYVLVPESDLVQIDLTIRLLRIMLPSVIIFGISGLVMGMLNAHQVFLVPALAPVMYSLGMIFGTLVLPKSWGISRLAIGVVLGAIMHLLVQLPSVFHLKERFYHFTLGLKNRAVIEVLKQMGPRLLGSAVVQLNFITNTIIALGQPEGSVSSISLAFALMLMPQMAIAQSVAIASLPTFSAQVALGKLDEMRHSLASTLRVVLYLAIPASLGLILLRIPLVQILYQRGEFNAISTQMVAWALLWYAAGLVGHSLVEILSRAFYALHDTRTPVIVGVCAMGLNILFSLLFSSWFKQLGWMPHGGLALANSLATALESIVLLILMRKRLGGLEGGKVLKGVIQAMLATVLMATAIWGWSLWAADRSVLLYLLGGLLLGTGVYGLIIWLMKIPEVKSLLELIKQKLLKKALPVD
jgi:putative peptidoglycan lipid II flippase